MPVVQFPPLVRHNPPHLAVRKTAAERTCLARAPSLLAKERDGWVSTDRRVECATNGRGTDEGATNGRLLEMGDASFKGYAAAQNSGGSCILKVLVLMGSSHGQEDPRFMQTENQNRYIQRNKNPSE